MVQETINEWVRQVKARYHASPLPEFFAWWWGELSPMVPEDFKRRLMPPAPSLWIVPQTDSGDLDIWRDEQGLERVDTFKASEDASLLKGRWRALVEGFEQGAPRILLCLPADSVLDRVIELPSAVESNLHQSLQYQLDQFTPFDPSTVYFDHQIVGRDSKAMRLHVALRVVPVQALVDWTDRLDAVGIKPHVIDRLAQTPSDGVPQREGFNLLPEAKRPNYSYQRAQLNWRLAGVAALVLVVLMASSMYIRGWSVDRLQAQVGALRSEAQQVMALQSQLGDALDAANFLAERREQAPVMVHVLDEVTRLLPQRMWLQQMQVRGEEITMMGYAEGSQQLVELINDSPLLKDAAFRGRVTIDPETNQERFTIQALIDRRPGDAVATTEGE